MTKFSILDSNMPFDWFDFLGERVEIQDSELLIVTDNYIASGNYPKDHPNMVALLIEPPMRRPEAYNVIIQDWKNFKYVFTFVDELLQHIPNAKECYFGGSSIDPKDVKIYPKSKNTSIIVSSKRDLPGTLIRHEILERIGSRIDKFGYMNPIKSNFDAMHDYYFNICIENSKFNTYFTEKICDCFALGTIPIYWGTEKISNLFNPKSILTFNSHAELDHILNEIDGDKGVEFYESVIDAVQENLEICKKIGRYHDNIPTAFQLAGI